MEKSQDEVGEFRRGACAALTMRAAMFQLNKVTRAGPRTIEYTKVVMGTFNSTQSGVNAVIEPGPAIASYEYLQ